MFAIAQGFFVDLYSGGMHGLFSVLYLSVFCGIRAGSRFLNLHTPGGQVVTVWLVTLVKDLFFMLLVYAFSRSVYFSGAFLWNITGQLVVTGLFAPPVFFLLDRLKASVIEGFTTRSKM